MGPAVLGRVHRALPDIDLELHAHRSPVALDAVRAGEFALAIVAGATDSGESLWSEPLLHEEMVVLGRHSAARAARAQASAALRTTPPRSPTCRRCS